MERFCKGLIAILGAVGLLLQGCAHYQSGSGAVLPFNSIEISPVTNNSQAPQVTQVLNHDLRETFIRSGKVQVENSDAQTRLVVDLIGYDRETIATNSQDTGLARKYAITLTANCSLLDLTREAPYFSNRKVRATLDVFLDSGQTQAETQAIPLLSKKLSEAIATEVLQVW